MAWQQQRTEDGWRELKERIQARWPGLGNEELETTGGNRDALLALLETRLGYAQANAERDLDEVMQGRTIEPRDVADEETHTGTSGPVPNTQVPSGLTSFPSRAAEERAARGDAAPEGERGSGERPHERAEQHRHEERPMSGMAAETMPGRSGMMRAMPPVGMSVAVRGAIAFLAVAGLVALIVMRRRASRKGRVASAVAMGAMAAGAATRYFSRAKVARRDLAETLYHLRRDVDQLRHDLREAS